MRFILESGYLFWNPLIWFMGFVGVLIVVHFLTARGQKKYKKDTEQTRVFVSGEEVPKPEQRHITVGNIYWGFFETLKEYYNGILRPHTGIINDYIIWFVGGLALTVIILLIAAL
ncbi:MAG: hydrogenase [Dehalococcoidia bacterium]